MGSAFTSMAMRFAGLGYGDFLTLGKPPLNDRKSGAKVANSGSFHRVNPFMIHEPATPFRRELPPRSSG
jgi:hypothetical protein